MDSIGPGIFLGALAIAIAWYNVARMRQRDPFEEMRKLKQLHDDGLLDEGEYKRKRRSLLGRL